MSLGAGQTPVVRVAVLATIAAAALAVARTLTPTLPVAIVHDGDRLVVSAAGSRLETRTGPLEIDDLAIVAADTMAPVGGSALRLESGGGTFEWQLPRRFAPPGEAPDPVGDWWVDDGARRGVAWRRQVAVEGPFALETRFRGRSHSEVALRLQGPRGVIVGLRWGLNRNEITLRDATSRRLLAWTSIDPDPAAAAAGILSTLLAALALAAALAALWATAAGVDRRRAPAPQAADEPVDRRTTLTVALLAAVAAGLSLWLAGAVLGGLPHTADEAVQWLQARWLLEGQLWQPAVAWQDQLDLPFTYVRDGRWLSQYPVIWPAMLAPWVAFGVPWLLPPLLGGLQVVLVFRLGHELFGRRTALLGALLTTFSPLARVLFATTLSHAGASTLLLGFALLTMVGHRRARPRLGLAAGLVLGLAFGMRPLPAVAAAAAAAAALLADLRRRSTWRLLVALTVGGVLGSVPTLAANAAVTGNPFRFGYALAEGRIYAVDNVGFALANLDAILVHLEAQLLGWGWGLPARGLWMALPFALALLPFLLGRARPADRLLLGCAAIAAFLLLGSRAHGLYCYGARYLFEFSPCLLLLVARGLSEIGVVGSTGDTGPRPPSAVTVAAQAAAFALVAIAAVGLPARLALYRGYFDVDRRLVEQIEAETVSDAVVLFRGRDWRDWLRAAPLQRPGDDPPLVFARSAGDNAVLRARFPQRSFWVWSKGELHPASLATANDSDLP